MQDYTILATEPHSDTIIKIYASNERDFNDYIREMKEAGYRGIFAVEVVR